MKKTLWAHKTLHTFVYTRVRNYQICLNHRDSRYSVALVPISGIATQVEFRARAAATRAFRRILHSGCSRKWWRTHITLQNNPSPPNTTPCNSLNQLLPVSLSLLCYVVVTLAEKFQMNHPIIAAEQRNSNVCRFEIRPFRGNIIWLNL